MSKLVPPMSVHKMFRAGCADVVTADAPEAVSSVSRSGGCVGPEPDAVTAIWSARYFAPITPPIGPEISVRASSRASTEMRIRPTRRPLRSSRRLSMAVPE